MINALVHAFVEVEKEWIAQVEALPDARARARKVRVRNMTGQACT